MAVADEDQVGVDAERRVEFGEAVAEHPVGGDAAIIEQPCRCQQEGARADRGQAAHAGRHGLQPCDQHRVPAGGLDANPARHDQGVETAGDLGATVGRHDLQATLRLHRPRGAAITRTS